MPRSAPILVAILFVGLAAAPPAAEAGPPLPAQGMFDACDPTNSPDRCGSRLQRLSAAGFRVVQKMGAPAEEDLPFFRDYADIAHRLGMKVIWGLRDGATDSSLGKIVPSLRAHPATWGYYIFDEPSAAQRDRVAAFAARVKALDPTHPRIVMGCGNCYGGEGSVSFLDGIDVTLGSDIYPVHEQAPNGPSVTSRVASVAAGLQRVADRTGRKTVIALQAWRWGDSHFDSQATGLGQASRFPTRQEIEDQRNAALANARPELILWFRLEQVMGWERGQRPWFWAEPSDPVGRWTNLVEGAFAPVEASNRRPVARFTLRSRRGSRTVRVLMNARKSYDPDGRIVRYRWYASGRKRAVCGRRRCSIRLRRSPRRTIRIRLVVRDRNGALASRRRKLPARVR